MAVKMADDNEDFVSGALSSIEGIQGLDEDTIAYVSGVLAEDPFDDDARSAVRELLVDALEDVDGVSVCDSLFELLDLNKDGKSDGSAGPNTSTDDSSIRKLSQTITMKEQDVETFASGLRVKENETGELFGQRPIAADDDEGGPSKIASFYANMIDPHQNEAIMSERNRRKARQKELRIKAEEEERQRAIKEAMNMFQDGEEGDNERLLGSIDGTKDGTMSEEAQLRDVRLLSFDLPNLRGGGPNLLSGASLILARGRRYGLMGRNGCGKVGTFFISTIMLLVYFLL